MALVLYSVLAQPVVKKLKQLNEKGLLREQAFLSLAGGRGLEPRLTVSETAVLPLDDPPFGGRTIIA